MEKLKERLNTLRTEADEANVRADGAEQDLKRSEQQIANKGIQCIFITMIYNY